MADLTKPDVSAGQTIEGSDVGELYNILLGDSNYDNINPNGVKTYVALIDQGGDTSDPTAAVIYNSLGFDIILSRQATGQYRLTPSSGLFGNNTVIFTQPTVNMGIPRVVSSYKYPIGSYIELYSKDSSFEAADGLVDLQIKIEVYP